MPFSNPTTNPWYYLDNFEIVLRWLTARYPDLLLEEEQNFIHRFLASPRPARALLVRMIMRKGELFRSTKLKYTEIGNIQDALAPLIAQEWVDPRPGVPLEDLYRLLLKAELTELLKPRLSELGASTWGKAAQLKALQCHLPVAKPLQEWLNDCEAPSECSLHAEQIIKVSIKGLAERFRLMFFGNLRQDWTEFVLADLGLFTYEEVSFSPSSRAFQTREEIDDYLHLHDCKQRFLDEAGPEQLPAILQAIPCAPYSNSWLEERRSKLLFQIGQHCERQQDWPMAQNCYLLSDNPGARSRRIRVLERQAQYLAALSLAQDALAAPEDEAEFQAVQRMLPRLQRLAGSGCATPRSRPDFCRIDLNLPDWGPVRVEEEVRARLSAPEAPIFYVENTLINSLFGLLCWDIIFAVVPGAFFHPFQQGPADLFRKDFHARRQEGFENRLARLKSDDYRQLIRDTYERKHGLLSPFVSWGALPPALLELALACIPAAHLQASFQRLLQDMRNNRTGLPDLIQFWPDEKRYRLIEVKGPGDRLQDNQLRWLDYCNKHAIPASVCYVQRESVA